MRLALRIRWPVVASLCACALLGLWPVVAAAGGPLDVGGPGFGVDGKPFTWDPAKMPIQYRLDTGPMAATPTGGVVISNATGKTRVQTMFQAWSGVPTAAISYNNAGAILAATGFAGGDVKTATDFNAVDGSCNSGAQSPIIFDADGSMFDALVGDPNVIGFAGPCKMDPATGHYVTAEGALNGRFQDGINSSATRNFELTTNQFNQAFIHEFGHFSGLDHSQINQDVLNQAPNCDPTEIAGLPVMFPILACDARPDVVPALPVLAPDDIAWISALYPQTVNNPPSQVPFASKYQLVPGQVFFSDGVTPVQGVNVIVRDTTNPLSIAVSGVSGGLHTSDPGQTVTSNYLPCVPASACPPNGFFDDNSSGDLEGSRDPALLGSFAIPVPAGTYTVSVESINPGFDGGSGLRPFSTPVPAPGSAAASSPFTVTVGTPVPDQNFTLLGTPDIFDAFESARLWLPELLPLRWREEIAGTERSCG
jgi:hypothetical protein